MLRHSLRAQYLSLILWVLDYLNSRPQFVRLSPILTSNTIKTNTGAPQGTVLSPFLFSIHIEMQI